MNRRTESPKFKNINDVVYTPREAIKIPIQPFPHPFITVAWSNLFFWGGMCTSLMVSAAVTKNILPPAGT